MRFIKRQTTDNLNIDWHAFYKNVFALIIPMALQNLINVGVTAVDVMMLGRVGEKCCLVLRWQDRSSLL